jgi:hypothetical protein
VKLSEKVARQELEPARLERISRRRIAADRVDVVRRMLALPSETPKTRTSRRRKTQPPSRESLP